MSRVERTPAQVGAALRMIRDRQKLTQTAIDGVSHATVRQIEAGDYAGRKPRSVQRYLAMLNLPSNAIERLESGEDPSVFDFDPSTPGDEIQIAALAGNLTPENRAKLEGYARALLDEQAQPGG